MVLPSVEFVSCALLSMSCSNTEVNRELKEPFHGTHTYTLTLTHTVRLEAVGTDHDVLGIRLRQSR